MKIRRSAIGFFAAVLSLRAISSGSGRTIFLVRCHFLVHSESSNRKRGTKRNRDVLEVMNACSVNLDSFVGRSFGLDLHCLKSCTKGKYSFYQNRGSKLNEDVLCEESTRNNRLWHSDCLDNAGCCVITMHAFGCPCNWIVA